MAKFCLLLTGNIAPKNVPDLERSGVTERENDYIQALEKWLALGYPLVFCENSGYDSKRIRQIFANHPHGELVQFHTQQSHLGKGHGEAEIFEYAFANARTLRHFDGWIVKVTGRYFIKNYKSFFFSLRMQTNHIIAANLQDNLSFSDSRFFIFKPIFFSKYLLPHLSEVNESSGIYFEHVLARAIHGSMAEGNVWLPLSTITIYEGYYATKNLSYRNDLLRSIKNNIITKLRVWAFRFKG